MPRYETHEWGDDGYDAVDYLIDNDPIALGGWFRRALYALEGTSMSSAANATFCEQWDAATAEQGEADGE